MGNILPHSYDTVKKHVKKYLVIGNLKHIFHINISELFEIRKRLKPRLTLTLNSAFTVAFSPSPSAEIL